MTLLIVPVPPESVASPIPPFTVVGATRETSPVGVPEVEVTVTLAVTADPFVLATGDVPPFPVRAEVVAAEITTPSGPFGGGCAEVTRAHPVPPPYPPAGGS